MFNKVLNCFYQIVKKDLVEINEKGILNKIEIHFIDNANEILRKAFTSKIIPYKPSKKDKVKICSLY